MNVRLYSLLRLNFENYEYKKGISIEISKKISVEDLVERLNIKPQEISMIFVNGKLIDGYKQNLNNNDVVKIFPHYPSGG